MSKIVCVSTIVIQLDHIFEGWHSNGDGFFSKNGYLRYECCESNFSVQICLNGESNVKLGQDFFPEIELIIQHRSWIEENSSKYLVVDLLNGWYDYYDLMGKNLDSQIMDFALELINKIRHFLSISTLPKLVKNDQCFWLVF